MCDSLMKWKGVNALKFVFVINVSIGCSPTEYQVSHFLLAGVVEKAVNRSDLESKYTVLCVLSIQSSILEDI